MTPATYTAREVAAMVGVSVWSLYEAARADTLPPGLRPVRVGRRLVWPRAHVDALLGLREEEVA